MKPSLSKLNEGCHKAKLPRRSLHIRIRNSFIKTQKRQNINKYPPYIPNEKMENGGDLKIPPLQYFAEDMTAIYEESEG